MTDVSHELGALRFVVESPLSSKVAMFNNQATQHKQSQLLNPFSHEGRAPSPKPLLSKDQYGKPLAGSLTEARGQRANMHVMKEMLELCQIIDSEGYQVKDEPNMRVIPFGELFNIYNYISDKVVGLLLRARKHKLLDFEGEMLYQRRDDDVPIFLLRPVKEIRQELNDKIEEIKRGASPAPQSTSVMLDKAAHEQKLKVSAERRLSKSRTPSPAVKTNKAKSQSQSPAPVAKVPAPVVTVETPVNAAAAAAAVETPVTGTAIPDPTSAPAPTPEAAASAPVPVPEAAAPTPIIESPAQVPAVEITPVPAATTEQQQVEAATSETQPEVNPSSEGTAVSTAVASEEAVTEPVAEVNVSQVEAVVPIPAIDELPTVVIEATATFVRTVSVENLEATAPATASEQTSAESA